MPATRLIGQQDQFWSPSAHWRLVCAFAFSSIVCCDLGQCSDTMYCAAFVFSQWFVQTKLSRKGDDLSTLTNKQVPVRHIQPQHIRHMHLLSACAFLWQDY